MWVPKTYRFDINALITRFKKVVRRREPYFWSKFGIKVYSESNSFIKWNAKCFTLITICDENEDSQPRARARKKEEKTKIRTALRNIPSPSPVPSRSLSHTLTPLAEHLPFGSKGYPHQTQILHYLARSEGTFLTLRSSHQSNPLNAIFCTILRVAKVNFWHCLPLNRATPWTQYFVLYFA